MTQITCATELNVYKISFDLAMRIFRLTERFPGEERYALTSQIRRSSRSVCMNLREAWAKRRYEAAFVNKLTVCDGELNETLCALDFALACGLLNREEHRELMDMGNQVGRMLGAMLQRPEGFVPDVKGKRSTRPLAHK